MAKSYIQEPSDMCLNISVYNALEQYKSYCTDFQYRMLGHILCCELQSRDADYRVPFSKEARRNSGMQRMSASERTELVTCGWLIRWQHDDSAGISHTFKLAGKLREEIFDAAYAPLTDLQGYRICNLLGQVPTPRKTWHHEPTLIKNAFRNIQHNVISLKRLQETLDEMLPQLSRSQVGHITTCYNAIIRQIISLEDEILTYTPAYIGSKTGRMFEQGGGMQNMPKVLKRAAYEDLGVLNYDIRSSQVCALMDWSTSLGGLTPCSYDALHDYVHTPDSKRQYAERIVGTRSEAVNCWKRCLLSLFFGAEITRNPHKSIYATIQKFDTENVENIFERFCTMARPFINARDEWLRLIEDSRFSLLSERKVQGKRTIGIQNSVGKWIDSEASAKLISAHLLQGLESAFIYSIIESSTEYEFEVLSNEHDGLIVRGEIPEVAVNRARQKSGFNSAVLEIKEL